MDIFVFFFSLQFAIQIVEFSNFAYFLWTRSSRNRLDIEPVGRNKILLNGGHTVGILAILFKLVWFLKYHVSNFCLKFKYGRRRSLSSIYD